MIQIFVRIKKGFSSFLLFSQVPFNKMLGIFFWSCLWVLSQLIYYLIKVSLQISHILYRYIVQCISNYSKLKIRCTGWYLFSLEIFPPSKVWKICISNLKKYMYNEKLKKRRSDLFILVLIFKSLGVPLMKSAIDLLMMTATIPNQDYTPLNDF